MPFVVLPTNLFHTHKYVQVVRRAKLSDFSPTHFLQLLFLLFFCLVMNFTAHDSSPLSLPHQILFVCFALVVKFLRHYQRDLKMKERNETTFACVDASQRINSFC